MSTVDELSQLEYEANRQALFKHTATRGYQIASLLAPPLYIGTVLVKKKPFLVNNVLRTTWISGVGGTAAGLGVGYMQYNGADPVKVQAQRSILAYDRSSISLDDHSTVGALIMAVLTPAIFYNRARLAHSILGGAGFGVGVGALTHYWRESQKGSGQ